jgi:hypothetical protein
MYFEYRPSERTLWDHDLRSVLMALSFGLVLFVAILLPTTSMVDNALGQGEDNIMPRKYDRLTITYAYWCDYWI